MKKKLLILISLVLAALSILSACLKAPSVGETENEEVTTSESVVKEKDALLVNGINITDYTVVYDGRASIGSNDAQKYFVSKMKQTYNIKLEAKTSSVDGYQIFIGFIGKEGNDSGISSFFNSCEDGMIGFDGKNVYILAKDNAGLYSVIDAFFAKAVENGEYTEISVSQNEKVATTKDSLRVMTYNVFHDMYYDDAKTLPRDITALAKFIKSQDVDVFGTQETRPEHEVQILKEMPNYRCYEGIKLKGSDDYNMIFWNADKYKKVSSGFQYLTSTPYVESKIPESNSFRGFSYVVLESLATHKQFMFVNVHLTYRNAQGDVNDDNARFKQVQYLNKFLEGSRCEGMPVILVGDFNSIPSSQTITSVERLERFGSTLKLAKNKDDVGGTLSGVSGFTERDKDKYIFDHIFVTSDRIATDYYSVIDADCKQNGRYLSDHLPIVADITIY